MPSRATWPKGLRVIYWIAVTCLIITVWQAAYWVFTKRELYPETTLQGVYAVVSLLLGVVYVAAGALAKRRLFSVTLLASNCLDLVLLAYVNVQFARWMIPDVIAARGSIWLEVKELAPVVLWNSLGALLEILVTYYLLRFEFKWFSRDTSRHRD